MRYIVLFLLLVTLSTEHLAKNVTVSEVVNTSGYSLKINEVHEIQNELYILATLEPPARNMIVLPAFTTVSDTVTVETDATTQYNFILYPVPSFGDPSKNTFIKDKDTFQDILLNASKLDIQQQKGPLTHLILPKRSIHYHRLVNRVNRPLF